MTIDFKKHFSLKLTFAFAAMLICAVAFSQVKSDTAKPALKASIGPYAGGKAVAADVKKLMSLNPPLKVTDAKGATFQVLSYEMTWKKIEQSEDVKTGKPKSVYYLVGTDVKSSQIPESWREQISNEVKKGEEITFSQIIYFDAKKKANFKLKSAITLSIL